MSDKSPLFVSASELLAHAVELYTEGNERKFKFVILHLANAVELILKDRLIDKGISIYLPRKSQTIGIWESFEELQKVGVDITERPVIELLVDDRNTIQHRFGFPNSETVYYYIDQVVAFFTRFLHDEYGVALVDVLKLYLDNSALALIGLVDKEEAEYAALDTLFALSPESAVLQAYNLVESKYFEVTGDSPFDNGRPRMLMQNRDFSRLLTELTQGGFISPDAALKFRVLREMRNRAAHAAHFPGDAATPEWAEALNAAKELLRALDKAAAEGFFHKQESRENLTEENDDSDGALPVNT